MTNRKSIVVLLCALALLAPALHAQKTESAKPEFLTGPATAKLGSTAEIAVPAGFVFIDGETMRKFLKAAGEPVSGNECGSLEPTNGDWSVMFRFNDVGYVKDEDKDKLDADKLLEQIKAGTEAANKVREKSGNPPVHVIGWDQPPRYNEATHNLEWAVRGECEGRQILNYNTRLLGRKGVMSVILICEPDKLPTTLPEFKNLLADYKFEAGQTYAEYRPGDKIAKYGLAALVVGGAAVGAAKLGLLGTLAVFFKKGFKVIIVAVVAVLAFFRKIIGRLFGRRDESGPTA